jgi:hypothetical protein
MTELDAAPARTDAALPQLDAGRSDAAPANNTADAAPPGPEPTDCGFVDWGTPFTWTPTSVSMSVLQTAAGSDIEKYIGSPEVIDRGAVWDMFYAMSDAAGVGRIGHAVSSDRGRTWTRDALLMEPHGDFASAFLDTPGAVFDQGAYKLYYFGNAKLETPAGQIGLALQDTSAWTFPQASPVLSFGASDAWDGLWVESPVVRKLGATYFMWYTANDSSWVVRHGVATSSDGVTWQKFAGNPVVSPSADTARFDSFFPGGAAVAQAPDGTFLMFFGCGSRLSAVPFVANLCLATSAPGDGKTFRKYPTDAEPMPIIAKQYFESLSDGTLKILNGPMNLSVVLDRTEGVFKLYYENQSTFVGLLTLPVCRGM